MLPVLPSRARILYCVEQYRTVVIQGETGSGKTTQIPQYLHQAGWTDNGFKVVCTQPRRVAAITIAARVASEVGTRLGDKVGYNVQFDRKCDNDTKIIYCTDGLLVRETMSDPLLSEYSVIMVDEAHERTVYTDILMGLLRKIRRKRPELRVIISSATLDAKLFKRYMETNRNHKKPELDTAVIVSVEGRQHTVDVLYLEKPVAQYIDKTVETILNIHRREALDSGDILVFLPGQDEIQECLEKLKSSNNSSLFALPLYSGLSSKEQLMVFKPTPPRHRKCILATNIAETSVTIDGIAYVVDSLYVKLPFYDPTGGMETLIVQPVSQAQAKQRAGRAGRIRPGKAFRLCKEVDFASLEKHTTPEMQRTNMTWTILQLKALGIDDVLHFPFISPPSSQSMIRALEILYSLDAIDDSAKLTSNVGSKLIQFPVEPRIAACLLYSLELGCSQESLSIACMLSQGNSPFVNLKKSNLVMRSLGTSEGDHLLYLNLYNMWCHKKKSKNWCYDNGINASCMARADELRGNLERYLKGFAKLSNQRIESNPEKDLVLKSFVKGFFANAAKLSSSSNKYNTVKDNRIVSVHPSSVFANFGIPPQWVMYQEITLTTEEFIRDISQINPLWLIEVAPHFYHQPKEDHQVDKRKNVEAKYNSDATVKRSRRNPDLEDFLKGTFKF